VNQVPATVITNTEIMPGYHLLCVETPDIAAIAKPGQFVMVRCGQELTLRRPLSVYKIAKPSQVYFLFAVLDKLKRLPTVPPLREVEAIVGKGQGTLWLSQRHKGDSLDLLGPLGNGFSIEPASKKLLLVAGGIGIAPLAFLAEQALSQGKSVTLLLGARSKTGLYPQKHLPSGIESIIATEDGTAGRKGLITDILPDFINGADQIYACGPLAMYEAIAAQRQQGHLRKPVQVSLEVRMGCGLGGCYGCSIRTRHGMKQVCLDGPVFNLDEILWQEVKL